MRADTIARLGDFEFLLSQGVAPLDAARRCGWKLRNDWWCKGLGMQQPKSDAYGRYLQMKKDRKTREAYLEQRPAEPLVNKVAGRALLPVSSTPPTN